MLSKNRDTTFIPMEVASNSKLWGVHLECPLETMCEQNFGPPIYFLNFKFKQILKI